MEIRLKVMSSLHGQNSEPSVFIPQEILGSLNQNSLCFLKSLIILCSNMKIVRGCFKICFFKTYGDGNIIVGEDQGGIDTS